MRIGIIGGKGWIGSALGRALIETGQCPAGDIVILTRGGVAQEYFGHAVTWARDVADLVDRSDIIVVSVRPQDWPALALDARGKPVISVMAGVPLRALPPRSLRALPNAAAELRQSYTPWLAGPDTTEADRQAAVRILGAIGRCEELDSEAQLDLMTATAGAGPAYSALMARAVIDFLVQNGVRRSVAEHAAEGMICGAAPLLAGRMDQAGQMVQVFVDYRGTTAAGLETAIGAGFETALKAGLRAATDRAAEMGEGF